MADKNLPSLYLSNPMQAASAPVTMAGSMVVSNAEMLSGLVLCQLKREGLEVVPEIMIPLVGHVKELRDQKAIVQRVAADREGSR